MPGSRRLAVGAFALLAIPLAGCATLIHGRTQRVEFVTNPPGADVKIDETLTLTTPCSVKLDRRELHHVVISASGYEEYHAMIASKADYTTVVLVYGAVFLGLGTFEAVESKRIDVLAAWILASAPLSVPGIAIDSYLGGLYKLTPGTISVDLVPAGAKPVPEATPAGAVP